MLPPPAATPAVPATTTALPLPHSRTRSAVTYVATFTAAPAAPLRLRCRAHGAPFASAACVSRCAQTYRLPDRHLNVTRRVLPRSTCRHAYLLPDLLFHCRMRFCTDAQQHALRATGAHGTGRCCMRVFAFVARVTRLRVARTCRLVCYARAHARCLPHTRCRTLPRRCRAILPHCYWRMPHAQPAPVAVTCLPATHAFILHTTFCLRLLPTRGLPATRTPPAPAYLLRVHRTFYTVLRACRTRTART